MSDTLKQIGARGEDFAVRYLQGEGLEVLERNWRCKAGEADIIASDNGTLVFIEVKTRRSIEAGFPEESVTKVRRRRYETIAAYYLSMHEPPSMRIRFDVISIMLTSEYRGFLKHHQDVFGSGE
jgi:putative endonuclease